MLPDVLMLRLVALRKMKLRGMGPSTSGDDGWLPLGPGSEPELEPEFESWALHGGSSPHDTRQTASKRSRPRLAETRSASIVRFVTE